MVIPLSRMCEGEKGKIRNLELPGEIRERLCGLGFVSGEEVQLLKIAPLGDPKVFRIKGTNVTLRDDIAMWILVETGSVPLSYVGKGKYVVNVINGGWGLRERLGQLEIREGTEIEVIDTLARKLQIKVRDKIQFLPKGQAMRIIVRER